MQGTGSSLSIVLAVFAVLTFSCQKEKVSLPSFHEITAATTDDLSSVWFLDEQKGFVSGGVTWEKGIILSTQDGGNSWRTDTVTGGKIESLHFDRMGRGYACGVYGDVFSLAPAASHWEVIRTDFRWHRCCFFQNPNLGVIVSGEGWRGGEIRRLAPDFNTVDTMVLCPNELNAVWFSDSTTVHAVGAGWVMRSDNAGRTWQRLDVTGDLFKSVHFPTANIGYICGYSGSVLKTTDGGRSWKNLRDGNKIVVKNQKMRAIWFVSAEKGYVVGEAGLFWRTENGGQDWVAVAGVPEDVDFTDVFAIGRKGWAVGRQGRIFCFED